MICSGLFPGSCASSSKAVITAAVRRFLLYSLAKSIILRVWFLLSAFNTNHRGTFIIFILCFFLMARVCSPHQLDFVLDNFCCLIFPTSLIFFSAVAIIVFLNSSLLHPFFFMTRGLPKSFPKFPYSHYWKLFPNSAIPQSLYTVSSFPSY